MKFKETLHSRSFLAHPRLTADMGFGSCRASTQIAIATSDMPARCLKFPRLLHSAFAFVSATLLNFRQCPADVKKLIEKILNCKLKNNF